MSSSVPSVRRLAVGALAAVTLAAGTALLATPASAAVAERLVINPSGQSVSAGTCTPVVVSPLDNAGALANAATVTVVLDEGTSSATQDVDFCTLPSGTAPVGGTASFTSAGSLGGLLPAEESTYTPGPSITPTAAAPTDGDAARSSSDSPGLSDAQANPTGRDRAVFRSANGGTVRVGVVGLTTGTGGVTAIIDADGDSTADAGEPNAAATVTFTDGGAPGSDQAANAVRSLTPDAASGSGQQGQDQRFTVVLKNAQGNTVAGVTPQVRVQAGGANSAAADQQRADCGSSSNEGVSSCVFRGARVGTDTLLVFVQQAFTGGTSGPDAAEPRTTVTRSTTLPAVAAGQARFLDLTPETTTTVAGQSRQFVVTATAASGAPAQGVRVVLSEEGPGRFENGTSGVVVDTDVNGAATATVLTTVGETPGNQVVTATVQTPASTMCQAPATGTTPAGRCTDSAVNAVTAASPSPSATGTGTPTTTPSATPSSTATATPTATTASPAPSTTAPQVQRPTVTVNPSTIIAVQQRSVVSGTAAPGSTIEIHAYSRPSTTYQRVRSGTVGADGRYAFEVGPSGNTRLFARTVTPRGNVDSDSIVLTVRTSLNLKVARTGTRTVRFTGSLLPKRPGQLITVFYEVDGRRVIAARARNAANGTYNVTRTFTGTGTFTFFTGTGTDNNNAANNSNRVRATIR